MIKKKRNKLYLVNFKSLGIKLNLFITIIILLIFIALFSFMAYEIYTTSITNAEKILTAESKNYANEIYEIYIQNLQSAKDLEIRLYNNMSTGASREKMIQAVKDAMESNENIYGVGLCFEPNAFDGKDAEYVNKSYHDTTGRFIPYVTKSSSGFKITGLVNYDKEETKWYQIPKKTNKMTVAEPFIQKSNDKNLLLSTLSIPIKDNTGKFIGTLTLDTNITNYQEMVKTMDIDNGYASIITAEGNFVAHSTNPNMIMKNLINLDEKYSNQVAKIAKGEQFTVTNISPETNDKMLKVSVPINFDGTDINWSFSSVIPYKTFLSNYYDMLKILIILIILSVTITLILLSLMMKRIVVKPIAILTGRIEQMANYDFIHGDATEEKYLQRKDEIGRITNALRIMKYNIASLITDISKHSRSVYTTSQELSSASEQTAYASDEVARAIDGIAKCANEQANATEIAAVNVEKMGYLLEQEGKYMQELNLAANQIDLQKEEGFKILRTLIDKTGASEQASQKVYEVVLSTNENAIKIESASQMIQSIADQTNLLSLNAAIEAARAGESGRGFAVVADEVRKLAEQSNEFTKEIIQVIKELKNKSEEAVLIMAQSNEITKNQTESVIGTEEKFKMIADAIVQIKEIIEKLNHSSNNMNNKKEELLELVQTLSVIAEENAAGSEEVSASVEEQVASIQEMANASENLSKVAQELQFLIEKFQV